MWNEKMKKLWIDIQLLRARHHKRDDLSPLQLRKLAQHRRQTVRPTTIPVTR